MPSFASLAQSAIIGLSKWIFYVKNHLNLSDFFSLNNNRLDNIFCWKKDFLLISIFKSLEVVKSGPIFDQAEKLGKPSRDAYNPGLWLFCKHFWKMGSPKVSPPTLTTLIESIDSNFNHYIQISCWKSFEFFKNSDRLRLTSHLMIELNLCPNQI